MKRLNIILFFIILAFSSQICLAQQTDSTKNISDESVTKFSGSVGITNNGFSIIPTFSLNNPAVIINLAWRKKRFSFEPDIRLVPDATKGSMLWWLRYRLVENKKFALRTGVHPAFSLIRRSETVNGTTREITEMLRFVAFEVVPSYQIHQNFGVSAMYLEGHGLQTHGPQTTRVLFLNTSITNISFSKNLRFSVFPSVFFLNTDGYKGDYITVTGVLSHKQLPFSLQSTINQTLKSDVPGNKEFMWNVMLAYNFSKRYKKVN
jgi:hypothetical protein